MAQPPSSRWLERLVRSALWLYPPDFRRRYGASVLQAYRDVIAGRDNGGRWSWPLAAWLLNDVLITAIRTWLTPGPGVVERWETNRSRGGDVMGMLWIEARQALRSLSRRPVLTVGAVLTLAVGIGGNTAIFSVVNAALLKPFPYPESDRLVWISNRYLPSGTTGSVSAPEYWEFRGEGTAFEAMSAVSQRSANFTGGDTPLRLRGLRVSSTYFEVLGVGPAMGRAFSEEEERPGAPSVIIVSHGLWQSAFGGDPSILGRSVELDGRPLTVVGVMPQGHRSLATFVSPSRTQSFWTPLIIDRESFDGSNVGFHNLSVVGRLNAGADLRAAEEGFIPAVRRLETLYPEFSSAGERDVQVESLRELVAGDVRPTLVILLTAVGLVLLVACANVTNLLLVRGEERMSEIAVRSALGASRRRVLLHVLMESLLLSLGGGALGLLFAWQARGALVSLAPEELLRFDAALDGWVLAFTAGVVILTGLLAGFVPAVRAARGDLRSAITSGGRGSAGPTRMALRRTLVVGQIAAAVVLVAGSLLLLRSIGNLRSVDPGFDPSGLLMVQINASRTDYSDLSSVRGLYRDLLARVEAIPGVSSAAASWQTPMQGGMSDWPLLPDNGEGAEWLSADPNWVSNEYFETLEMRLVAGRLFEPSDLERGAGVVVLNETAAGRLWPDADPIGKRVNIDFAETVWRDVVGVVQDVKARGLGSPARAQSYSPMVAVPFGPVPSLTMTLRTTLGEEQIRASVQEILAALDPRIPMGAVQSMTAQIDSSMAGERFLSSLLVIFSAAALLLGAVGVYGSMAYMVSLRTKEIGLRIALGAKPDDALKTTAAQAGSLGVMGVTVGLVAAAASSRVLEGFLFGVSGTDMATLALVALVVLFTTLLAAVVPGRRAASIDPIQALRQE